MGQNLDLGQGDIMSNEYDVADGVKEMLDHVFYYMTKTVALEPSVLRTKNFSFYMFHQFDGDKVPEDLVAELSTSGYKLIAITNKAK